MCVGATCAVERMWVRTPPHHRLFRLPLANVTCAVWWQPCEQLIKTTVTRSDGWQTWQQLVNKASTATAVWGSGEFWRVQMFHFLTGVPGEVMPLADDRTATVYSCTNRKQLIKGHFSSSYIVLDSWSKTFWRTRTKYLISRSDNCFRMYGFLQCIDKLIGRLTFKTLANFTSWFF